MSTQNEDNSTNFPIWNTEYRFGYTNVALEYAKYECNADPICKGFYHNSDTDILYRCTSGFEIKPDKRSILYLKGRTLYDLGQIIPFYILIQIMLTKLSFITIVFFP